MEPREVIAVSILASARLADPPIEIINEATANALADMILAQLGGAGYRVVKADHPI